MKTWDEFIASIESNEKLPQRSKIIEVWNSLKKATPDISYPAAFVDEYGSFHFGWEPEQYSFGIEISNKGLLSWFFVDYDTENSEGSDDVVELPERVFELTKLLVRK